MAADIEGFFRAAPKAELHLHIEGTLEPELMLALAEKHSVELPYPDLAAVHAAYDFEDLQSFLDLYFLGASVLRDAEDFHALASAYLDRARAQNVVHLEMMFDPQTHTDRGVAFATVMDGFTAAIDEAAAKGGPSVELIMSFLRHLDEDAALATLDAAAPFADRIAMIGLDSSEVGHPPEKFARAYARAADEGFALTAHAGEEGPPAYITGALDALGVQRIDHGVRCLEDAELVARLARERIPLTVCPQSNVRLCVVEDMAAHPILTMLDAGLSVSVNSDDPAYFGGHLVDNYVGIARSLSPTPAQALALVRGGFEGSLLDDAARSERLAQVDACAKDYGLLP